MSGSPKYTTVTLSDERRQREAAARAARSEQRRRRQAEREARLRALEDQRARKRLARQAAQVEKLIADSRRAASEHLAAIGAVVADVARDMTAVDADQAAGQVTALQAELAALESQVRTGDGTGGDLAACERAADALRVRALALRTAAYGAAGRAGRPHVVAELRRRFAALQAAASVGPGMLSRCGEVLAQLESAAAETHGVRFEALHGTAEHMVASLERKAADAVSRGKRPAGRASLTQAAKEAVTAQEQLDHLTARLAVLTESVQEAISDAAAFGEHTLHERLAAALAAAHAASAAGQADELGATAGHLEALLPEAEAQLDDAAAAYDRRGDLAVALRDVLTGRGMAFAGGNDADGRFVMRFERPGGAVYTAMIDSDASGGTTLSYAIDGEHDVPTLISGPGAAVCDQTEAFLDAVHDELATSGFAAGELRWDGKPPRSQARQLPRQRTVPTQADSARRLRHG